MKLNKGKNLKCWTESVLYCLECELCLKAGTQAWYVGETSRSGFERGEEHNKDGLNASEYLAMVKHGWDYHQLEDDQVPQFRMRVVRSFRGALQHQVAQAIAIEMAKPDILLNSKSEWGYPQIPRLRIEVGDRLLVKKPTQPQPHSAQHHQEERNGSGRREERRPEDAGRPNLKRKREHQVERPTTRSCFGKCTGVATPELCWSKG